MSEHRDPAIGLVELSSIATGIACADAMVKAAPIGAIYTGTIHPGRYLVLVSGDTASVEVALDVAADRGGSSVSGSVFLPDVHPEVVAALVTARHDAVPEPEALGIVETATVPPVVDGADAGVKAADVNVAAVLLADGLGGKGYVLFGGSIGDVEAAVEAATQRIEPSGDLVAAEVVAQLHPEIRANLGSELRFNRRLAGGGER